MDALVHRGSLFHTKEGWKSPLPPLDVTVAFRLGPGIYGCYTPEKAVKVVGKEYGAI